MVEITEKYSDYLSVDGYLVRVYVSKDKFEACECSIHRQSRLINIVFGKSTYDALSENERLATILHEMGHAKLNQDMFKILNLNNYAAFFILMFSTICFVTLLLVSGFTCTFSLLASELLFISLTTVKNLYHAQSIRNIEYRCDEYVKEKGKGEDLVQTLIHLDVLDGDRSWSRKLYVKLFWFFLDHPSTEKRIKRLREI